MLASRPLSSSKRGMSSSDLYGFPVNLTALQEAERSECVDMCIGEAPPFGVDAKLVLSTASTKTHRYRRVAKQTVTAMI